MLWRILDVRDVLNRNQMQRGEVVVSNSHPKQAEQFSRDNPSFTRTLARLADMSRARRSVRHFQARPIPAEAIRSAIEAATSAPSGANQQPWFYLAIDDPAIKAQLREVAEAEEFDAEFHQRPKVKDWAEKELGAARSKSYFEQASWVVALFTPDPSLPRWKEFYVEESAGISLGWFLCTLQLAGLGQLVHEPVAEDFLSELGGKGPDWRLHSITLVGHAEIHAEIVSKAERKRFSSVAAFY